MEEETSAGGGDKRNEVSLPGTELDSLEKQAIFHVLGKVSTRPTAGTEQGDKSPQDPQTPETTNGTLHSEPFAGEDARSHIDEEGTKSSCDNLVTSSYKADEPVDHSPTSQENVLVFESHLIETINEYPAAADEGVGIKELPPIADELTEGTSKVETLENVRTIIEVEPVGATIKKPVERLIETSELQQVANVIDSTELLGESPPSREEAATVANLLVEEIEREVFKVVNSKEDSQEKVTRVPEQVTETKQTTPEGEKGAQEQEELHKEEVKEERPTTGTISDQIKTEERIAAHSEDSELSKVVDSLVEEIEREVLKIINEKTTSHELPQVPNQIQQEQANGPKGERDQGELHREQIEAERSKSEITSARVEGGETEDSELSKVVDKQLSEVTSILESLTPAKEKPQLVESAQPNDVLQIDVTQIPDLKIISVPSPKTALEVEERKLFIESLPQIQTGTCDAQQLALDCKREYYQSLKKYLINDSTDKPPVPLQTYRWEDLRRAKERGGYPWTHLYKRPLGPDEQPEIVLMLRKSQELHFASESPKSLKKVRIDDQVTVKETERYIQELAEEEQEDKENTEEPVQTITATTTITTTTTAPTTATEDTENHSLHSENLSCVSDSALTAADKRKKCNRFHKIRRIFRRRKSGRTNEDAQSLPGTVSNVSEEQSEANLGPSNEPETHVGEGDRKKSTSPPRYPIMKKLKSMADRQKKRLKIRHIHLGKGDEIVLTDQAEIVKLKNSPKTQRSDIPRFVEKQDSEDVLEIVELDESPSRKRKDDDTETDEEMKKPNANADSIVEPEEIIEIPDIAIKREVDSAVDSRSKPPKTTESPDAVDAVLPRKTPRLRREHVYEEIDEADLLKNGPHLLLEESSVEALKQSLATQDKSAVREVKAANNEIPLDRMGSSDEEQITGAEPTSEKRTTSALPAPLSSIDSTSSDEDRIKTHLQPVAEESETGSQDDRGSVTPIQLAVTEHDQSKLKSTIKKEISPEPSEKKVTFSHVEDEAEPHREDIELPPELMEATKELNRLKHPVIDHDYEPIGSPTEEKSSEKKESPPVSSQPQTDETKSSPANDFVSSDMKSVEEIQKDIEDRFFSSATAVTTTTTTITMPAQTESHTEQDSQVTTETVHEVPAKAESRMKGFIASAQDRTRQMQAGFKTQAGKIKTKLRPPPKKIPSGSPKAQDRKRFKAPEFSKIKMPEIKRPDMSKLKDFKRPEFTKFNKPDMSKFKLPEKLTTIKLRRSKSFKENETTTNDETFGGTVEAAQKVEAPGHQKKLFEFNFGTYPRAFRRKKKPAEVESSLETATVTEATSVRPSTETQPSSSPQGDRGPGPVRSRWADKFSDVSYNDSEGSRYRRYGSEQESFERESSLERRMREDLEDTGSEERNMGIMGRVVEDKQFAEFDEENRAIHEISNLRSDEFKRRPFVHQDSDLRSEDSKEVVGWTEKDIQKNKLLRKAELEAEASYLKYQTGEPISQETQSTASSGKKVVMEEIDDDEFFLRKRGVSEDNIDLRQYISNAIREGYDTPMNALQHVGETSDSHEYRDFDVPPPKPRRLHKSYTADNASQELEPPVRSSDQGDDLSLSQSGHDFFGAPQRPQRKTRGRRKYSTESEEKPKLTDQTTPLQYFANDDEEEEEEEEDLLSPSSLSYKEHDIQLKDINISGEAKTKQDVDMAPRPQPPRRQKRHREVSLEKDSYINGFAGRSISNSFLQPADDVIVYRTEHEYHRTHLATPEKYSDGGSESIHQSRSVSNEDFADHSSRGAQSLEPSENVHIRDKFVIDMMENDGYAVVRKEPIPKPTPPARRRKRFSRSPGERFATVPIVRSKRSTSPPQRPPPPRGYSLATDTDFPTAFVGKSSVSSERHPNYEDDYEEPGPPEPGRPESPRNLQSGEIINKMKYRPLPPPPRPPREKRPRSDSKRSTELQEDRYEEEQREPDEIDSEVVEVEVSTQTDPLPDDFVCEEFEITDDMKVIEPRRRSRSKTLEELLKEELDREVSEALQSAEDEQLARGLQRFREANQRSLSERSRASSQADRSRSHSRAQTPSAILIERQVSTPVQSERDETMVEAALIVRPIDDLELEEEELRREGLLTDSSQHSVSDTKEELNLPMSDTSHAASSVELDEVLAAMTSPAETDQETQQIDDETKHITRHYPHETSDTDRNILEMPLVEEKDKSFSLEKSEEEYRSDESVLREEPSKDAHEPYEHVAESDKLKKLEDEQLGTPTTEPPLPPPRRKSTTAVESSPTFDTPTQGSAEKEQIVFAQSLEHKEEEGSPRRLGDREVECLREQGLEDLQVGQRTVSPIHETPTHSDELERISPHFEAKNIELPPGWIDDIVERIRKADLAEHLTTETQTSPQSSSEKLQGLTSETVPPPKPPRHKELDKTPPVSTLNADEQTQTDQIETPSIPTGTLPQTFPSVEYLQSLAPLAFYNLHRKGEEQLAELGSFQRPPHRHRHHEHKHSSPSSETGESTNVERVKQEHHRHADNQSITRAGRQFITACSLALARAINHLTTYVRGNGQNQEEPTDVRLRQVSSIVVLFIAITFSLLLYMLSGRSIHTHHWDYFNPPGNEGRPS